MIIKIVLFQILSIVVLVYQRVLKLQHAHFRARFLASWDRIPVITREPATVYIWRTNSCILLFQVHLCKLHQCAGEV